MQSETTLGKSGWSAARQIVVGALFVAAVVYQVWRFNTAPDTETAWRGLKRDLLTGPGVFLNLLGIIVWQVLKIHKLHNVLAAKDAELAAKDAEMALRHRWEHKPCEPTPTRWGPF